MVFITQTDIFGYGIPVYTINRRFEETDDLFDDGSHIIYVNGSYKGNDAIGKLMHDFGCKKPKDMYYSELVEGIEHFKKEKGGRRIMSEAVEKYAEGRRMDTLYVAVLNLMKTLKFTAEQAMDALCLSPEDRAVISKRL